MKRLITAFLLIGFCLPGIGGKIYVTVDENGDMVRYFQNETGRLPKAQPGHLNILIKKKEYRQGWENLPATNRTAKITAAKNALKQGKSSDLKTAENQWITQLRKLGVIANTATETPANVDKKIRRKIRQLSSNTNTVDRADRISTRIRNAREDIESQGGSVATAVWHETIP